MGNYNTIIKNTGTSAGSVYYPPKGITISGSVKRYATYADMQADKNPPQYAYVVDASADPTVNKGSAFYRNTGGSWKKMYEEESMDLDLNINEILEQLQAVSGDIAAIQNAATLITTLAAKVDTLTTSVSSMQDTIQTLENTVQDVRENTGRVDTSFISGTAEQPAEVTLADDEWCVMTGPFTATLPSNPSNGDQIHMSIEHGSADMKVVAPAGTTINGSNKPCLVGIDDDGSPISYVSFYFVYNAAQNNWIVL